MNLAPFHAYTGRGESGKEPVCKIHIWQNAFFVPYGLSAHRPMGIHQYIRLPDIKDAYVQLMLCRHPVSWQTEAGILCHSQRIRLRMAPATIPWH